MSEKPTAKKTKQRTSQDWKALVMDFEQSNLSQSAFCRQQNIPTSTFFKWRNQFGTLPSSQPDSKPKSSKSAQPILLKARINHAISIEWSEQVSPGYIAELLTVLNHAL